MNFSKLEKSITGAVKEQQIKLGYRSEKVRLYYPLTSLNRLLGKECSIEQMQEYLKEYAELVAEKYGNIDITNVKELSWLIIDDRCLTFEGDYSKIKEKISNFNAWYK